MPRILSLNIRQAMEADSTDQVPVVLVKITHPDADGPIYLSTDPTERLSLEPLRYGTRSQGQEWEFVPMAARLPDETEEGVSTQLILENLGAGMVAAMMMSTEPGQIDFQLVLASSPELIEEEYLGLFAFAAQADLDQIEISIARESEEMEPCPADRMTASQFPGLFR
ncbi:hypothetical protein J2X65_003142 [Ancylobacter sp. 3268]|uniref:hypothetical protein n=1 Tax=Ancylobacter sp. 3268 TaxID=2817752 RepID=UPI0028609DDD|nr:hypothetical protein [Ancylobacter sp. 3268]MDR6953779.1 hypothetical protein [Ancylobacter sp. 3268]